MKIIPNTMFMDRLPGPKKGSRNVNVQEAIDYLEDRNVAVAPCKYVIFKQGSVFMFENDEALVDFVEREKNG